jgi:PiT family inorganic phosphate transporter
VRWGVAANIGLAWVLTLPVSAAIAWCLTQVLEPLLR